METSEGAQATYAVVEFTEESGVAVVPVGWLVMDEEENDEEEVVVSVPVRRPSAGPKRIEKAVKEGIEPSEDFMSYAIRVMYASDDYNKARQKLVQAEVMSDLATTESDGEEMLNSKTKRKTKPCSKYVSSSEEEEQTPRRTSPRKSKSPKRKKLRTESLPSLPAPPPPPKVTSPSTSTETPRSRQCLVGRFPKPTPPRTPPQQSELTAKDIKYIQTLEEIREQVKLNTLLLKKIQTKLDNGSQMTEEMGLPEGISFPLKDVNEMDALDERLKEDSNAKARVLANLSVIGGETIKLNVQRLMTYAVSHNLALQLNWKGKGAKRAFQPTTLMTLIEKSVRRNRKDVTASEVETCVKDWLRYAADREGGRKRRAERRLQQALQPAMEVPPME